jgi:hypothetical protein
MKKQFTIRPKFILIFLLGLFILLSVGCSTKYKQGEILLSYKSVITAEETEGPKIPVSLRVKPIDFTTPNKKTHGWGNFLKFIPILCLIPTPGTTSTNMRYLEDGQAVMVKRIPGEVEKVLTDELNKTMLYNNVVFEGDQKDYDIQGKLDFKLDDYIHIFGLGQFLGCLPPSVPIVILTLPTAYMYFMCEAHFDVVETGSGKIIFSKDYYSKEKLVGWFPVDRFKIKPLFGEKVLPSIIKEFINDLKVNLKKNITTAQLNEN